MKFLNCQIDSSKKVFQPRVETEFWVRKAIKEIKNSKSKIKNFKALDIFAGTGCIGISVLKNVENSRVDFADISEKAIEEIKINLKLNKIQKERYQIYKSNLFEKLKNKKYHVIFANPPYIALDRIQEVQKEVLKKEPKISLFAGRDGTYWIKKFLKEVRNHLKNGGIFYLEFDPLQKEKIKEILKREGFKFSFRKDQFKKYRWLKAIKIMKKFVISLGGSVICPKEIDIKFLKRFYFFIKERVKKGYKFIIVAGGGNLARSYQKAASKITKISDENKDWLGIEATKLNALLLQKIFKRKAHPVLFDKRFKIKDFGKYPIIIGSGWKPGCSTDFDTIQIAVDFGVKLAILLGKPDYVYTSNPDKNKNAKPIEKMSWKDYFKLIPKKWIPGFHAPVDPMAAKLAQKEKIQVIIASGKNLENLKKILAGKKFKGTIIS